ncbi:Major facilitator superfamily [Lasiodiplodia theobromae]|uniref:MFS transporter OpS2 n=1 Tax=Lasiodiplodia theobromae TaxID=45133 RepID=A0A5N5DM49_9PEZI|nr:MFS multidrug transporter [Lasiodiplodia theobromae]KAB2578827.1 MFS transporter OpS2 [Lasiodiplodia theobromae]KAF4535385.1 MFS multidrug transporter [Lasiodiplodia theobromae]KAF9638662.1 Major facilitator superfamily [Lasiodiplodia theobromae]
MSDEEKDVGFEVKPSSAREPEEDRPKTGTSSVISDDDEIHREQDATQQAPQLHPIASRSSAVSRTPTVIPRRERRGLLAHLCLIPEVSNPYEYSRKIKWTITFFVALAAMAAPTGSAIILPALNDIAADLDTTLTITNMSVAFYMLAMAIFPLWWSSFSETLGRRTIYLSSFVLFILWGILSAVANNISMLIVMRVLSGGASASVQAVGGGTIADIWEVKERGRAMGIFYLGPLCGPLIAPIVGGALAQGLGWRSTQWFLVIYGAVVWLSICFMLPETLRRTKNVAAEAEKEAAKKTDDPLAGSNTAEEVEAAAGGLEKPATNTAAQPSLQRVSTRQSVQRTTTKWLLVVRRCFIDPLRIILYLRFPAIFFVVSYATIAFACLYVLNISIETTFSHQPYGFSTVIVGLLYIPNSLGYMVTSIFGGRWIDSIMRREAVRKNRVDPVTGKLQFRPEDRMRENAWLGAALFPAALVWYGWTAQKGVFWLCPMIANFFFGIGSMLIFAMATTMLTEFMPKKASNGIALNNFVRNIFSCVGSVVAQPLISAIGNGWLFTGLAVISFVWGSTCIWAMMKFGERMRKGMDGHKAFS